MRDERSELGRLSRRIAAGDVEAARRALAILEGREEQIVALMSRVAALASASGDDASGSIRSELLETVEDIGLTEGAVPPPWIREFGLDWRVPWQILRLVDEGIARDASWRNDVCPSFSREFDVGGGREHRLALWSDHHVQGSREFPDTWRFHVVWTTAESREGIVAETDDPGSAVAAFRRAIDDALAGRNPLERAK